MLSDRWPLPVHCPWGWGGGGVRRSVEVFVRLRRIVLHVLRSGVIHQVTQGIASSGNPEPPDG